MNKSLLSFLLTVIMAVMPMFSWAQESAPLNNVREEEAQGKMVWEQFRSSQKQCSDLQGDDFERIGEYMMGTMIGSAHESMNTMMKQMMGEENEEAMHQVMGKRFTDCDASASLPATATGFMPMMGMMSGSAWGRGNGMMGWNTTAMRGGGFPMMNDTGSMFMILWWALIVVGLVALIRWILLSTGWRSGAGNASSFEILKQRYARGEIDKKEYEEKKRDLS